MLTTSFLCLIINKLGLGNIYTYYTKSYYIKKIKFGWPFTQKFKVQKRRLFCLLMKRSKQKNIYSAKE